MSDIVVWVVDLTRTTDDDEIGWAKRSMFPGLMRAEPVDWAEDDVWFWKLARALTEDERFT